MTLKKYINQIDMNKIAKTALAIVFASTFTFSSSQAFANETTTENNFESVQLQSDSSNITSVTTDTTSSEVTTENKTDVEVQKPTLLPGHFFYFAKLSIEKIKLILTTDDVKEAELFAKFASERLAEAEVLFADGKEALAIETIEVALEDIKVANNVVVKQIEPTPDNEKTDVNNAPTNEDAQTKDEVTTDPNLPTVEAPSEEEKVVNEIEEILSQNIIALTAAMEKVQNPVAKAALQKNIAKSYTKLEKKLAKIEAKLAKESEEIAEESDTNKTVDTKMDDTTKVEIDVEKETEDKSVGSMTETTVVIPSIKEQKVEEKKVRKELKQETKKQKEIAKKEIKEKREKFKREMKEVKKSVKESKGNSHKKENDKK
jgi:hypothetical protein